MRRQKGERLRREDSHQPRQDDAAHIDAMRENWAAPSISCDKSIGRQYIVNEPL